LSPLAEANTFVRRAGILSPGGRNALMRTCSQSKVWNSLPDDVTSAPSLSTFRRHLKTYAAVTTLTDIARTYYGNSGGVAA